MAFDSSPSGWFAGLTASATELTIPYTALNDLTETKSHPDTGDVREVIYNICEAFSDKWANTAEADRPDKATITTSSSIRSSLGVDTITKIYTIRVELAVDEVSVSTE